MKNIKLSDIQRNWILINAQNQILGRLSSQIAQILMGKNKAYFTPHLDTGDHVVVINAAKVVLSGKKESQKKYYQHSGYPGGLKVRLAKDIRRDKPESMIRHAIVGMLPKTKLGKTMLKKLFIYPGVDHPHTDKFAKISTNQ